MIVKIQNQAQNVNVFPMWRLGRFMGMFKDENDNTAPMTKTYERFTMTYAYEYWAREDVIVLKVLRKMQDEDLQKKIMQELDYHARAELLNAEFQRSKFEVVE